MKNQAQFFKIPSQFPPLSWMSYALIRYSTAQRISNLPTPATHQRSLVVAQRVGMSHAKKKHRALRDMISIPSPLSPLQCHRERYTTGIRNPHVSSHTSYFTCKGLLVEETRSREPKSNNRKGGWVAEMLRRSTRVAVGAPHWSVPCTAYTTESRSFRDIRS